MMTTWVKQLRGGVSLVTILGVLGNALGPAYANPLGGQVVAGDASISGQGTSNVTVTQSTQRAAINWDSFSIGAGEQTNFIQPNSQSIILNRVIGADPSHIMGTLNANGQVILVNRNGVVFGAGSQVNAAGLVATTHDIGTDDFMNGSLRFKADGRGPADAAIVNDGTITITNAGAAAFVAPQVRNNGVIIAEGGTVNLASSQGFGIDLYGDGLVSFGLDDETAETLTDATGTPIKALVDHAGTIKAGKILLTANAARHVVNQAVNVTGRLDASRVSQQGGKIIIAARNKAGQASGVVNIGNAQLKATGATGGTIQVTGDQIHVKNSRIDASGTNGGGTIRLGGGKQGGEGLAAASHTTLDRDSVITANAETSGRGGSIVLWSDDQTDFAGQADATGGTDSGDGGFIEISGKKWLRLTGQVDLRAAQGKTGELLLDPQNITIQNSANTPAVSCTGTLCTPTGDSSILTVAILQGLLATSNVTVNTGNTGAQTGNIVVADNVTWSSGNRLMLEAYKDVTINNGVTISNTYAGNLTNSTLPVLLSIRADATGINNGGSITNNGTIDFSQSTGAVSLFYDMNGAYTAGTQNANGTWIAPANNSVSNQFTVYRLINSVSDLTSINSNLAGVYALGKSIDGGGATFNGNAPMGTFTGILDGQYCALSGGSYCGVTGLTLTASASANQVGLFTDSSGIIRNLSLGLDVTQNYTSSSTAFVGTIAGTNSGTIANVTSTGSVNYTATNTANITAYAGGLVGRNTGTIKNATTQTGSVTGTVSPNSNVTISLSLGGLVGMNISAGQITGSTSSQNISFVYKGTSTGTSIATVGGLVGYNSSTTANSIMNSSASGVVTAGYFSGFTGNVNSYVGGLVGQNGNNTATSISNVFATGNVSSYLSTVTSNGNYELVGGLIGFNWSTLATAASPSVDNAYATGNVIYNGTISYGANAGGLIGQNTNGWIKNSYATGNTSFTGSASAGGNAAGLVGALSAGGISDSYATGAISNIYNSTASYTSYVGGLVGYMGSGSIINSYAQSGSISATSQVGGTAGHIAYVGGLVGYLASGTITGSTASKNISYVYKGTSTNLSYVYAGGLVGYNVSIIANSVATSSASGAITADYFSGYTGDVNATLGGLIGQSGNNTATSISSVFATGNVSNTLNTTTGVSGRHAMGGLIGYHYSSLLTSAAPAVDNAYATGTVTYNGAQGYDTSTGGLIGNNQGGWINNAYASGAVSFTGYSANYTGGLLGRLAIGGVSNSYALGNVTSTFNGNVGFISYAGGLVGYLNGGTISNSYTQTGAVNVISQIGGTNIVHIAYVGGLVGHMNAGQITSSTSSQNVSYVYKGTSTGISAVDVGGLVGLNTSTTANSIVNSSASGMVTAGYFSGYSGTVNGDVGGLIGQNGNNSAVSISQVFATGNVSHSLNNSLVSGNTESVGGLIGNNYSTLATSASPSVTTAYATGTVTYNGTSADNILVGGLIGLNQNGWVSNAYATGAVTYSGNVRSSVGGLIGNLTAGGVGGSYAAGHVSSVFTGTTTYSTFTGGLIGYMAAGSITNSYTQTGTVTATSQVGGTNIVHTAYVGGLVGQMIGGSASGSTSSQNVSYLYKGTSTGTSVVYIGGLFGSNISGTANTVSNASASGSVTAGYFSGYSGNVGVYMGGALGQNGNNTATSLDTVSATGAVSTTLTGSSQNIGGLVGYNNSNLITSGSPSINNSFATGSVTYNGAAANVGGLIGYNQYGWVKQSYATGAVSYTGNGSGVTVGGLIGSNGTNGVSNAYATGAIDVVSTGTGTLDIGGLFGSSSGTIASSYSQTGAITVSSQISGSMTNTIRIGGLGGTYSGTTLTDVTANRAVSYVYKSTTTGTSIVYGGGLIGYISSAASLTGTSYAAGAVTAELFTGYAGTVNGYLGGLIGQNGNNNAASLTGAYATGSITSTLGSGTQYVGGLIGDNNSTGTISGASASGAVTYNGIGASYVGGLIGFDERNGAITNSTASGTVSNMAGGHAYTGGLIGRSTGVLTNSYATGAADVIATSITSGSFAQNIYVGGQIGYLNSNTLTNIASARNVSFVYKGTSTGTTSVYQGGSVGWNMSSAANSISGSSASGNVSAGYVSGYSGIVNGSIGGLIGQSGNNTSVVVNNISASGSVSSVLSGNVVNVGGLIGLVYTNNTNNTSASPAVNNASATGNVTYAVGSGNVGGLIGYVQNGWVSNSNASGSVIVTAGANSNSIGGLIGRSSSGVSNTYATGNVELTYNGSVNNNYSVGGLMGLMSADIDNSYSQTGLVKITSQNTGASSPVYYVGGLVGQLSAGTIVNIWSSQSVVFNYQGTSTAANSVVALGGLIGYNARSSSTLSGTSYATGSVTAAISPGYSGSMNSYVGGLIGQNGNNTITNVTGAYATGHVTNGLSGGNAYVGGFIGYNNTLGTVSGSTASGNVAHNATATASVGGFVGYDQRAGTMTNNTSSGSASNISGGSASGTSYLGGFAGYTTSTMTGSYSTSTTDVVGTSITSGGAQHNFYVGGQIGYMGGAGILSGVTTTRNVSYVYQGTSTAGMTAIVGGLVGLNASTATDSINNITINGTVTAGVANGYNGNLNGYLGGLVGQNGNNTATSITTVTSSVVVADTLNGGNHYTGGLVGYNNSTGAITGATSSGNVSYNGIGSASVGGFVGYDQRAGTMTNSTSSGSVSNVSGMASNTTSYLGGFAGYLTSAITNSYSTTTGNVVGTSLASGTSVHTYNIGGQVGYLAAGALTGINATQNVSYVYKGTSTGTASVAIGGLAGTVVSSAADTISGSSATGQVTTSYFSGYAGNASVNAGGLAGQISSTATNAIINSSATGSVTDIMNGGGHFLGGLVGYSTATGAMSGSTASGNISYNGIGSGSVGGFLGYGGALTASFVNNRASGTLSNISASANSYLGGFAGRLNGVMTNSYSTNTADISAVSMGATGHTFYVGGQIGYLDAGGALSNVHATTNVSYVYKGVSTGINTVYIGGLVGMNVSTIANSVTNASSAGQVSASYFSGYSGDVNAIVGGLIAQNGNNTATSVSNIWATGNVINSLSTRNVSANPIYTGGLIGYLYSTSAYNTSSAPAVSNAYATGAVTYNGNTAFWNDIGGLIGNINVGWVKDVYATGNVTHTGGVGSRAIGGLIGWTNSGITNAYATGHVSYTGTSNVYLGGLAGYGVGAIDNAYATGNVTLVAKGMSTGTLYAGGLIGNTGSTTTITNSRATDGTVSLIADGDFTGSSTVHMGGLAGQFQGTALTNVYADRNVSFVYKGTGTTTMTVRMGGLVGVNSGNSILSGTSYATGHVIATNEPGYTATNLGTAMGGLIGYNGNASVASIYGAYATGNVTARMDSYGANNIGGLIGFGLSDGTIDGSYATGHVSYIGNGSGSVGGFIGYDHRANSVYTNNYATGTVENIAGPNTVGGYSSSYLGGFAGRILGTATNNYTTLSSVTAVSTVSNTAVNDFYVGGYAGYVANGDVGIGTMPATVDYIYKGTSTGNAATVFVGGLVGYFGGALTLNNYDFSTDVTARYYDNSYGIGNAGKMRSYIGTLAGQFGNNTAVSVTNSVVTGQIYTDMRGSGQNSYVGGLVGYMQSSNLIALDNVHSDVGIDYQSTGLTDIGGLVGWLKGGMTNSYYTGDVSYTGSSGGNIGGIAGRISGVVDNVYATGDVTYNGTSNVYMGGLFGNHNQGNVTNSYATGNVTYVGTDLNSQAQIGGLIGMAGWDSVLGNTYAETQDAYGNPNTYFLGENLYATGNVTYIGGGTNYPSYGGQNGTLVGGLIGHLHGGYLRQSHATGDVTVTHMAGTGDAFFHVGGLVAWTYVQGGLIADSWSNGNVTGISMADGSSTSMFNIGGITGFSWVMPYDHVTSSSDVSFVYKGTSTGTHSINMGGIIGQDTALSIKNSHYTGNMSARYFDASYNSGAVQATMGGIMGLAALNQNGIPAAQTNSAHIISSVFSGTMSSDLSMTKMGGILGETYMGGSITDSYSTGILRYTGNGTGSVLGGVVGRLDDNSTINRAYAVGYMNGGVASVGGVAGTRIGSASITDSYWDRDTTGATIGVGSGTASGTTGLTTTELQAALRSNFATTQWGILGGISYPYLNWQVNGLTPQVVSGKAYADAGVTGLQGERVALAIDGVAVGQASVLGSAYTGANGYYYYLLANDSIASSGADVLAYLPGTVKANSIYKDATESVGNFNLFGQTLSLVDHSGSLAYALTGLSGAAAALSNQDRLFALPGGQLALNHGTNLNIRFNAAHSVIDTLPILTGNSVLMISSSDTVDQSVALDVDQLVLRGSGTYNLTHANNNIRQLAARTGTITINNGGHDLSNATILNLTGITVDQAYLSGAGTYYLNAVNNRIDQLSAHAGGLYVTNGGANIALNGITTTGHTRITDAGQITLNHAIQSGGQGDSLVLSGTRFINQAGANAVQVTGTGRALVWSVATGQDILGGLTGTRQYNAFYGLTTPMAGSRVFLYQTTTARENLELTMASTAGASQLNQLSANLVVQKPTPHVPDTSPAPSIDIQGLNGVCQQHVITANGDDNVAITCAGS